MFNFRILIALMFSAILSGCDEPPKTQQWFRDHPAEMDKVFNKCKQSGDESLNCRNAQSVHLEIQQKNAPVPKYSY